MDIKTYLLDMPTDQREPFATACGTTLGHLYQVAYGKRRASANLAIGIERETHGAIRCETLRPDIDWAFLRTPRTASGAAA